MKRTVVALLLLLLFLSGCGTKDALPQEATAAPETSAVPEVSAAPETSAVPEETAAPEETAVPDSPEEEPPADPIAVEAEVYAPEGGRYCLLDSDELQLDIIFTKDPDSGAMVLLHAINRTENDIYLEFSDVILNGNVQVAGKVLFTVPAEGERYSSSFSNILMTCATIGYQNVKELSAKAGIQDALTGKTVTKPCAVSIPEGIRLSYFYTSFCDMRADRQVLMENDQITVALLCCGLYYSDASYPQLCGVLWVENRGSESIPVGLSSVSINGVTVALYSQDKILEPGNSCLIDFNVYKSDFELTGIRSIESLSLQILTSQEENSAGARRIEGGAWYPVALAESGKSDSSPEEGELLYDDGLLELRFIRADVSLEYEEHLKAEYTLLAVNRRTEGVSLYFCDPLLDGQPYINPFTESSYISCENDRFGPQSRGYMMVSVYLPEGADTSSVPELSLMLQVRSQGGDSIFYSVAGRIIMEENEENKEEKP